MDEIDYKALCKEIEEEMKWEYQQMMEERYETNKRDHR